MGTEGVYAVWRDFSLLLRTHHKEPSSSAQRSTQDTITKALLFLQADTEHWRRENVLRDPGRRRRRRHQNAKRGTAPPKPDGRNSATDDALVAATCGRCCICCAVCVEERWNGGKMCVPSCVCKPISRNVEHDGQSFRVGEGERGTGEREGGNLTANGLWNGSLNKTRRNRECV